jgi:succinate semialdehyde reductase (NADPH)
MKAAVLPAVGAPLVVEEIPTPKPRAGEVLLRVRACGVCHTDLHVVKGEVRFPVPAVLGHEVSGVVDAVGPEVRGVESGAPWSRPSSCRAAAAASAWGAATTCASRSSR